MKNKMNEIYIIHCFNYKKDRTNGSYTVGWFHSFEEAEEFVMTNIGDIFEYYYNYAVIESVKSGHARCEKLAWYTPHYAEDGTGLTHVEKIEEPEVFKNLVNFGMG